MDNLTCPFCKVNPEDIVIQNEYWYSRLDKYPVTNGHLLIIPHRHIPSYFDTTEEEKQFLLRIIDDCKQYLDSQFHPDGYNIGINIGEAAGQTVMHLHIHVIPRYKGDVENPKGGVRGVIPSKQRYR